MAEQPIDAYRARLAYARSLLLELDVALREDAEDQSDSPHDWAYAETMGDVGLRLEWALTALAARPCDRPSDVPPLPR